MRTEDLKRIILKMSGDKKFYGYEIHKQLVHKDIKIEISRLYRILNEMLKEKLLDSHWEKSRAGPRRRVYQLSNKGKEELNKILLDAIKTIHSFYRNYLTNLPPKFNVFNSICSLVIDKQKKQGNIAVITPKFSKMHEKIIHTFHSDASQAKIFLIKPESVQMNLKLDKLSILDGAYNNTSLKDNYIDCLVVIGVPEKNLLETALKEWCRILKHKGKLSILTPSILINKYEDPLTIGEFVEKYEHKTSNKKEQVSKDSLLKLLKRYFIKVEERQIVHITIFTASDPRSL